MRIAGTSTTAHRSPAEHDAATREIASPALGKTSTIRIASSIPAEGSQTIAPKRVPVTSPTPTSSHPGVNSRCRAGNQCVTASPSFGVAKMLK